MTSTEFTSNRENYCYRHPDRQSFVLCQRCLRTVCHECQTPAAVGVVCPECMKDQRKAQSPAQKRAERRWRTGGGVAALTRSGRPLVTQAIVAVTTFVGLLQLIPGFGSAVTNALYFAAPALFPGLNGGTFEPWRLLTAALVHGGIWHFALNMLAVWMIGSSLEPLLGRWRFLVLYVLGAFGGSVAMAILAPLTGTVGASGAVLALLGALLVIGRHTGANIRGILVLLAINLVIGFIPGFNVAWQAHLGGLLVGLLVGWIYAKTRRPTQRLWQVLGLVFVAILLTILVMFIPPLVILS